MSYSSQLPSLFVYAEIAHQHQSSREPFLTWNQFQDVFVMVSARRLYMQ